MLVFRVPIVLAHSLCLFQSSSCVDGWSVCILAFGSHFTTSSSHGLFDSPLHSTHDFTPIPENTPHGSELPFQAEMSGLEATFSHQSASSPRLTKKRQAGSHRRIHPTQTLALSPHRAPEVISHLEEHSLAFKRACALRLPPVPPQALLQRDLLFSSGLLDTQRISADKEMYREP